MPHNFSIDELVRKVGNKFLLASTVAKRAIQIKEGDSPLVDENPSKAIQAAIKEIEEDKLTMGVSTKKEITPSEAIFEEEDEFENKEAVAKEEEGEKKVVLKKKKAKSLMA